MAYTSEDKLQLEVEKLQEDIKSLKKPFWQNPVSLIAVTTVIVSIGTIFFNIKNGILENKSAKIENSELKIEKRKLQKEKDSLNNVKNLLVRETSIQNIKKNVLKKEIDSIYLVLNSIKTASSDEEKISLTNKLTNKLNRSTFRKNSNAKIEVAIQKEKDGFNQLINRNFSDALISFTESENAYNGYKISYDIAKILMNNKEAIEGSKEVQTKVLKEITSKYNAYIPKEYKEQINTMAN